MKLLICTQTIDRNDPILGFFHRWVEEFAKHCDEVIVICLRAGAHDLPANVRLVSLGKETGSASKITYALRFWRALRNHRGQYDAVFVHMNPEYVMLGGLHWRLSGKRIGLWYVHKSVNLKLRIAAMLSNIIYTASPESFRLGSRKVHIMGHGIDTAFFSPDRSVKRSTELLSVGRLSKSKRHDLAIEAAALTGRELRIAGYGPEIDHLKELAHKQGVRVQFLEGLTQDALRDEYRTAACLIHTSETGSMDKVVLEALACDLAVVTTSSVFKDFPVTVALPHARDIAAAIPKAEEPRETLERVSIIRHKHSLESLIPRILVTLSLNARVSKNTDTSR